MASATGTATVDFGLAPGPRTVATVTGQTGITAGSHVEAFFMADSTADHSDYEHQMAAMVVKLTCGNVVDGVGFDIVATSLVNMRGAFAVRWVWSTP